MHNRSHLPKKPSIFSLSKLLLIGLGLLTQQSLKSNPAEKAEPQMNSLTENEHGSSYGLIFAKAQGIYRPLPMLEIENVNAHSVVMPELDCPPGDVKYELTCDIQSKLKELDNTNKPLIQKGHLHQQEIREAYHSFGVSRGGPSEYYEAKWVAIQKNSLIENINEEVNKNNENAEEEIRTLRKAAGC